MLQNARRLFASAMSVILGMIAVLGLLLALRLPAAHAAGVIYVDVDAPGPAHDGASWGSAYTGLQSALAAALAGDEIWVAEGTYTPGATAGASFGLKTGVAVYGGFAGTETSRGERDWVAHPTILSGDIGIPGSIADNIYNVVKAWSVDASALLDGFTISEGNARGGFCPGNGCGGGVSIDAASPTLAHLVVRDNTAKSRGGGIDVNQGDLLIEDVAFVDNTAVSGGGMCVYQGSVILTDTQFSGNTADSGGGLRNDQGVVTLTLTSLLSNTAQNAGGGVSNVGGAALFISDGTFISNTAASGGAIANYTSTARILTSVFTENIASARGGAIDKRAASLVVISSTFSANAAGSGAGVGSTLSGSVVMTGVAFISNTATVNGGGISADESDEIRLNDTTFAGNRAGSSDFGGGIYAADSDVTLFRGTFRENEAYSGAGIYLLLGDLRLKGVDFLANTATSTGGAIWFRGGAGSALANVRFIANTADGAGAVYLETDVTIANALFNGNHADRYGGGIQTASQNPRIINATFTGNSAGARGGGLLSTGHTPALTNTIFWANEAPAGPQVDTYGVGSVWVSYSLVEGSGGSGSGWNSDVGTDGGGNIDAVPRFVDADGADEVPGTVDDDLRLRDSSPALDAGDNTTLPADILDLDEDMLLSEVLPLDLDGRPRRSDTPMPDTGDGPTPLVDMGAFEARGWFVDRSATSGSDDGTSWADAFLRFESALAIAAPGEDIWVAQGVYTPANAPGPTAAFDLAQSVGHYGGFPGGGGDWPERDPMTQLTVLSGDLGGDDGTDANDVITESSRIVGTNAYHVITASNASDTTTLDGFVVTGGKASGSGDERNGGGLFALGGDLRIANVLFSGNSATESGGGVSFNQGRPLFINVRFSGNHARDGGGMHDFQADTQFANVVFSQNSATNSGGGLYINNAAPSLVNVSVVGNSATTGGGLFGVGSSFPIANAIVWGNTAGADSQITSFSSAITPTHSLVEGCGGSGAGWNMTLIADGGGNLDVDPEFRGASAGDLRLLGHSPAIDAGDNGALPADELDLDRDGTVAGTIPLDLAGNPRRLDHTRRDTGTGTAPLVDIGAYEMMSNTAPVLDDGGDALLVVITEDDDDSPGTLVSTLITSVLPLDMIADVDFGALEGVAVVDVALEDGVWEYSTDDGSAWHSLLPDADEPIVLAGDARVRFVPEQDYAGTVNAGLMFRAWDQTDGAASGDVVRVDDDEAGGVSAYSDATEVASIEVLQVNDPPTIAYIPDQRTPKNMPLGPVDVGIDDIDTEAGDLSLTADSSDATLVAPGSIALACVDYDCTVTITPTAGLTGTCTITITVDDGEYMAHEAFRLDVLGGIYLPLVLRG